jgi:putative tryptophan/tyrosine transport system substrate-binding protein
MFQTRRNVLTIIAGAAAWPLQSDAQQPTMPVIGFLSSGSPRTFAKFAAAFREGLGSQGYTEGRNVWIDYRWAEGHFGDLPALAADLVQRQVALIAAGGGIASALSARNATRTIPILFVAGFDPVRLKLVSSLNNPGGNVSGVSVFSTELATKRLELLHDLMPGAKTIAILVNPGTTAAGIEIKDATAGIETESATAAAQLLGLELLVIEATTDSDLEPAFASAARQQAGALLVSADPFFTIRRAELVALAARHALPAMYPWREFVEAGGLVSYGTELTWAYHQIGIYAGRVLNGTKPTDLPVQLPTNFALVINLKTAKALRLTVPALVLARVNETIE